VRLRSGATIGYWRQPGPLLRLALNNVEDGSCPGLPREPAAAEAAAFSSSDPDQVSIQHRCECRTNLLFALVAGEANEANGVPIIGGKS
jgi:hypothetical protein